MVNWTKIIEPYKKNLLIDLEKLLPIFSIKDLETASPEPPLWTRYPRNSQLYGRFRKKRPCLISASSLMLYSYDLRRKRSCCL